MSVKLKVITVGDRTTTGGVVGSGASTVFCHLQAVAFIGSESFCPQCKSLGIIRQTKQFNVFIENRLVCLDGDIVECACPKGVNRVIASPGAFEFIGYENGTVGASIGQLNMKSSPPEQHAQNARKRPHFADTCTPEDNLLLDGVYVWTEIIDTGHTFISVHENNIIYVFTYGRFGRTGSGGLAGDGILNYLTGDDARLYYREELYEAQAKVFRVDDVSPKETLNVLEKLWNSGRKPIYTKKMGDRTKGRGKVIDVYDLTGSNCATHTVQALKDAGSEIFETIYISITQIPVQTEEYFAIPVSLQEFLLKKSHDLSSMEVIEMTSEFLEQYPNIDNFETDQEDTYGKSRAAAANSSSTIGSSSGDSGGVVGGFYNVDE